MGHELTKRRSTMTNISSNFLLLWRHAQQTAYGKGAKRVKPPSNLVFILVLSYYGIQSFERLRTSSRGPDRERPTDRGPDRVPRSAPHPPTGYALRNFREVLYLTWQAYVVNPPATCCQELGTAYRPIENLGESSTSPATPVHNEIGR